MHPGHCIYNKQWLRMHKKPLPVGSAEKIQNESSPQMHLGGEELFEIKYRCHYDHHLVYSFLGGLHVTNCPIEFKLDREIDHHYSCFRNWCNSLRLFVFFLSVCQHLCFRTLTQKCFVQSTSNLTGR